MKRKDQLKNLIFNIKKHDKNIFSDVSGLKGYKVGSKKFPATREGYKRAKKAQDILWDKTKQPVSMHHLY